MRGNPMRAATSAASSSDEATPWAGDGIPSPCNRAPNFLRSSARSMDPVVVPRIGTPARDSSAARVSGVCPPSWTMTPTGCSASQTASTSSRVTGSKYRRSLVS
jgi:hypothetical protein